MSKMNYVVYGINGPVVSVKGVTPFAMEEMVYVGHDRLIGEVISVNKEYVTIQVYEDTVGLKTGEPVVGSGSSMSLELAPGLMSNIFDGIGRPLSDMYEAQGAFIGVGYADNANEKLWDVSVKINEGDEVKEGEIFATLPETPVIEYRCIVPCGVNGKVVKVQPSGKYSKNDVIAYVMCGNAEIPLKISQRWPIRTPRPVKEKIPPSIPLITGQRVIDTLFPVAKGGTAAIPGGFGSGKTMTQHQLAKWCDADIIVYVGCGERGNEMCQVLDEFSHLTDPKTNRPMTDRTVLIANTSNMPVAAREASIYTGVTIAEFYRDMGYHVAMMADSTSRWAEALREISGRLEEMPAEEGFPAYLPSRLSDFYERASYVKTLGGTTGSVTLIGAVSPQGADFSEPVTQNTKRFTRCFWALDKSLAYQRHYPAINWMLSYSEYFSDLDAWYDEKAGHEFISLRKEITSLLNEEDGLIEIVRLIGSDVLPDEQKLIIEIARVIRVGFLQQNAFHKEDTYVPLEKQKLMMYAIIYLYHKASALISQAIPISDIIATGLFEKLATMKYDVENDQLYKFDEYIKEIDTKLSGFGREL